MKFGLPKEGIHVGAEAYDALLVEEFFLEATGGFEPPNRGFADPRLKPLGYVANFLSLYLPA